MWILYLSLKVVVSLVQECPVDEVPLEALKMVVHNLFRPLVSYFYDIHEIGKILSV